MAKKIVMTNDERLLNNDLQKLVKRANQRLLRAERLTGEQGTFASKQLYDQLSSGDLDAVTKGGRVRVPKDTNQMVQVKKAVEEYLAEPTSTTRGIKKFKAKAEKEVGGTLDFSSLSALFQVKYSYQWIYEYYPGSDFWENPGNQTKKKELNELAFEDQIINKIKADKLSKGATPEEIENIPDEELRQKIENLYYYIRGE